MKNAVIVIIIICVALIIAAPKGGHSVKSADLHFTTTDLGGNTYTEDVFSENKLTMVNFWEPWCGPCVSELPELQELYTNYKSRGFNILGVCSSEDGALATVQGAGVSYPVLHYVSAFDDFESGYVPTTVFIDRNGNIVGETEIGAHSYSEWASIVENLL